VSTTQIAESWAQARVHGADASEDAIRALVRDDVASDQVEFLICSACRLEFANPGCTWKSAHYPQEEHGLGWDHEQALRELRTIPKGKLLDIGCADGQFLERAAGLGHLVSGVDFSPEDVDSARRKGFDVYAGDLSHGNELIRAGRKFDIVTMFQVIEHLEEPDAVFSQIAQICEPGALLMVGCPSHLRYTRAYAHPARIGKSDYWDYPPQHSLRWTPQALTDFVGRHGWKTKNVAFEPLPIVGAAAHLTALRGQGKSWYQNPIRRRIETSSWLARLTLRNLVGQCTGMRLFMLASLFRAPQP
jgi:SAM-dependent methyltransferase